jgi:hypothetical protein
VNSRRLPTQRSARTKERQQLRSAPAPGAATQEVRPDCGILLTSLTPNVSATEAVGPRFRSCCDRGGRTPEQCSRTFPKIICRFARWISPCLWVGKSAHPQNEKPARQEAML